MKYRVYLSATVSTVVTVEADSRDDAIEQACDNVPQLMFLNHTYPDVDEWEGDAWGESE
jgi:hypothetical protein